MVTTYDPNEQFASQPGPETLRMDPLTIQPKTFAPVALAPILPQALPVAFDTSLGTNGQWIPWVNGGGNGGGTIAGFVADRNGIPTSATLLALGNVFLQGKLDYRDIEAAVLAYGVDSAANLKIACRAGPLARGLVIQGLEGVH